MVDIVKGKYKNIDGKITLDLKLKKEVYDKCKKQVIKDMFLAYRRPAAKHRRVIIHSIGDNLDISGVQKYKAVDFYIEVVCSPTEDQISELKDLPNWYIRIAPINNPLSSFQFVIDKETDEIIYRQINE